MHSSQLLHGHNPPNWAKRNGEKGRDLREVKEILGLKACLEMRGKGI